MEEIKPVFTAHGQDKQAMAILDALRKKKVLTKLLKIGEIAESLDVVLFNVVQRKISSADSDKLPINNGFIKTAHLLKKLAPAWASETPYLVGVPIASENSFPVMGERDVEILLGQYDYYFSIVVNGIFRCPWLVGGSEESESFRQWKKQEIQKMSERL